ncbi:hypothetical protein PVAP13_2NG179000, partial [Panicum virgatum]
MQRTPMLFVGRPLFAEVLARASDLIHCNSNDGEIKVEGVLHYGKSGLTYHRRLLPIACQDDWENYVNGVMKNEIPLIDLLVSKLSHDSSPHMHSPSAPDPPIANRSGNVQHTVVVPDAESGPNFDGISHDSAAQCHNHDDVTTAQEIPLSQNHPRDIAYNIAVPPVPPATSTG